MTRWPNVLRDEAAAVRRRKARKLVAEKVLDALHLLPERLEVGHGGEKETSLLEYAGSCRDARECRFIY